MLKIILNLILITATTTSCATTKMGSHKNTVVAGNSIQYVSISDNPPTVVFESGLGDGYSPWSEVYSEVKTFSGVFAYSRPGYSIGLRRFPKGGIRTADDSASLLRSVLESSGVPAPYILVGHSIGGMYVLEFARDYPQLVSGLVLVDARLPEFSEKCAKAKVKGLCKPPVWMQALLPPHAAAELRGMEASEADPPLPVHIGSIPTVIIAATEPAPGASSETQVIWLDVQKEFADSLPYGNLVVAEGAGHYIQRDRPELVVEAIRQLRFSVRAD